MYPAQVRLCYKSEMFNWLRTLLTDMFWKKTMVGSFFLFGMFSTLSETFNKTFEERRKTTQQKQIGTQMKPSVLQKRSKCVFPVGLNIFGIFVKWCHYWHNKTIDLLNIKQLRKKQIPPSTTYRHKNPTGNELYGRNLCAVLFFSAWRGYLCIYGFLEETLGSVYTLCVCVCQAVWERERAQASKHVSNSLSMQRVEQLNSILNSPALWRGRLLPDLRQKKREYLFVRSFILVLFFLFVLDVRPEGCYVRGPLGILDLFLKFGFKTSIQFLYRSLPLLVSFSPPVVFPAFMCCCDHDLESGWVCSAGTGSLRSGRTGCSTRSQQKSRARSQKKLQHMRQIHGQRKAAH